MYYVGAFLKHVKLCHFVGFLDLVLQGGSRILDTVTADMVGDFPSFLMYLYTKVQPKITMIDVAATIGGLAAQQFALYSDS